MFRRPAIRLFRDCAQTARTPQRPLSTLRHTQQIPKRPSAQLKPRTHPTHGRLEQNRQVGTFTENAKSLWREYPVSVSLAMFIITFGMGTIVYVNYLYQSYIIGAFHNYPEEVAKKLRRAIYYTNQDVQPREALKYYKQALQVADELGMDPFSDEIMGVKIRVAHLMESIQNIPKAIQVLEILRSDCLKWEAELGGLERNKQKRTRVLAKTIAISVKLGELYSNPYVHDPAMAEDRLVWAVETSIKEKQRREKNKVNEEEEGTWITDDEMGASFEALAHNYEEKNKHYLASPLFLQALSIKPTEDCHSVVLMNNLASALAQQLPPTRPGEQPAARAHMVQNAKQWAQKALDVAATIKPPERDEECDMGCAVALHNLGEFAEMTGNFAEAKTKYNEAMGLAKAIGFDEGAKESRAALMRMAKAQSSIQN